MPSRPLQASNLPVTLTVNEGDDHERPSMVVAGRTWTVTVRGRDSQHVRVEVSRGAANGGRTIKLELEDSDDGHTAVIDASGHITHEDARTPVANLVNDVDAEAEDALVPAQPAHQGRFVPVYYATDFVHAPANEVPVAAAPADNNAPIIPVDDETPPAPANILDAGLLAGVANGNAVLTFNQHQELEHDWLTEHPEAAWVAPPRALAAGLHAHLVATRASPDQRRNLSRLPPAVLTDITVHGHISAGRRAWLKHLLGRQSTFRSGDGRAVMPDGVEFYNELIHAHLGATGHAHAKPPTMRKALHLRFVLGPSEAFYNAWVARCPGCVWPN
ncbi:hypothetical protein PENSPDRAFT_736669 [Peniophora sp. CONT]|nr:hypothetical protein PENSPDRAFT_736669 [Peniophora sp. CONT]